MDSIYIQGSSEKKRMSRAKQKTLCFFSWESGTQSFFYLGWGRDGIYQSERFSSYDINDLFPNQAVEAAMKLAVKESAALKRLVPSLVGGNLQFPSGGYARGVICCQGR